MTEHQHIKDISCEDVLAHLADYLHGEVDEGKFQEIEKHLDSCRSCFSRAEFEQALKDRIRAEGRKTAPDTLQKRLKTLMDKF